MIISLMKANRRIFTVLAEKYFSNHSKAYAKKIQGIMISFN
jgi:hypothetical protein